MDLYTRFQALSNGYLIPMLGNAVSRWLPATDENKCRGGANPMLSPTAPSNYQWHIQVNNCAFSYHCRFIAPWPNL